jgi:hypothetical protein
MSIDLSSYRAIQTALFCRIDIPDYQVLRFSNYNKAITIASESYTGIGNLLGITTTANEIRISRNEVTIMISGVPSQNISDVLTHKIKGSTVRVYRGIFDPKTGALLSITGNPIIKFDGLINNYSVNEDWAGQDSSNSINFICTSIVGLMQNKIAGRRTNPLDQKAYFAGDLSMDRVPNIANSTYNFGAEKT